MSLAILCRNSQKRWLRLFSFFAHPTMLHALGGKKKCSICVYVTALRINMEKNGFCCAPDCSNSRKTRDDLQFHHIQKDINRRRVWLKRNGRKKTRRLTTRGSAQCISLEVRILKKIDSVSYIPPF